MVDIPNNYLSALPELTRQLRLANILKVMELQHAARLAYARDECTSSYKHSLIKALDEIKDAVKRSPHD